MGATIDTDLTDFGRVWIGDLGGTGGGVGSIGSGYNISCASLQARSSALERVGVTENE